MLQLPNNCRRGKVSVYPANWKTVRANAKLTWYIKYRFYDDNLKQSKQVVIKGMNEFHTLREKQDSVYRILEDDEQELKAGLNKITGVTHCAVENGISPYTPFCKALDFALERVKVSGTTKKDIQSVLKYVKKAAATLKYERIPVSEVNVQHITFLFEEVGKEKKREAERLKKRGTLPKHEPWSANNFNFYRAQLGMIYKVLKRLRVVQHNLPLELEKEKTTRKIRETLTQEDRTLINGHLFKHNYPFWRCMQIFFHAGCREVELLNVRKENVDLENNRFKVLVKKGRGGYREEWRTIKFIVLDLWQELYKLAGKNQYIFHKGLVPGTADKPIRTEQLTRRWRRHVKVPFKVTADLYSLKHLNLDEIAKQKGLKAAQEAAGHASPKVTRLYAIGEDAREQQREHEFLKHASNTFA